VFRNYFITMQRKNNSDDVSVDVEPYPTNTDDFELNFRSYLNLDVDVKELYKEWSKRDPKYFGVIAQPLLGIRCLR